MATTYPLTDDPVTASPLEPAPKAAPKPPAPAAPKPKAPAAPAPGAPAQTGGVPYGLTQEESDIRRRQGEIESKIDSMQPSASPPAPQLVPLPAAPTGPLPQEVKHQIGQFGLMTLAMMAISGRASASAFEGATKFLAGAVQGINAGDEQKFRDDFQRWRAGVEDATARNNQALQNYANVLKSRSLTWNQKMQQLRADAALLGDRVTLDKLMTERSDAWLKHLTDVSTANAKLQQNAQKIAIDLQNANEKVRHDKAMEGATSAMLGGGSGGADIGGSHGDDYLKTLPASQADLIKGIDEGRIKISSFAWLKPQGKQLFAQVARYDPKFDMTTYEKRVKTQADFSAGKAAQTITSLNMVLGHMAVLKEAGDAMKNSHMPLFNWAINELRSAMGDPRVVNFNTAKQAVQDELERTFRGAAGSERDIEEWAKNFSPNASPAQMKGAWNIATKLLDSRINSLGEQYSRGMGMNRSGLSLLGPHAQQAYHQIRGENPPAANFGEMGEPMSFDTSHATPSVPPGIPPGSSQIGHTPDGKAVWRAPDGTQYTE